MKEIYRLWVYYGDGEYTSHVSELELAAKYANAPEYADKRPLKVTVMEHAGWYMSYYFDEKFPKGLCVGTANDGWTPTGDHKTVMERIYTAEENRLGEVRRPPRQKEPAA
jgi:hypothetical protein